MSFDEIEKPLDPTAGLSARRERRWGLIGAVVGSLLGAGSALIAVFIDGARWYQSGPYPDVFTRREILALDVYMVVVLVSGMGFATAGLLFARKSPYPRTEAYGAGLVGAILLSLSGLVLFIRLVALTRGA